MDTNAQKRIVDRIGDVLIPDSYGESTVRNLYYDTPDYRLIARSLEKPVYKEKIRLRSYCKLHSEDEVFVELKKKYRGIVYKRRVSLPSREAMAFVSGGGIYHPPSQMEKEIAYFVSYYGPLSPKVFLSYDRQAYFHASDPDFRLTFDRNILFRTTELDLGREVWGTPILGEDQVLMEIKCAGGIPLWMVSILSEEKLYKTSFSKYGTVYRDHILSERNL
jgi:SPX domain protein involved in polyphosphate accumulation